MAYAAKVMRSLIVDYARDRRARKRGGEFQIVTLDEQSAGPAPGRTTWRRFGITRRSSG